MSAGFRDLLAWLLWRSANASLPTAQKSIWDIEPLFSLDIGGYDLSPYVVAYLYEESADSVGGLTLWLENRGGRFDDLATDYPNLVEGAVVSFARGLRGHGVEPLQRTWVEAFGWLPGGQLMITCFNLVQRLSKFHFSSDQTYTSQTHSAIANTILSNVGMSISGSFGYSTDFTLSRFESAWQGLRRLTSLCHEKLYMDKYDQMASKRLSRGEAAGYTYDFQDGESSNHPVLGGTEVAQSAAEYNAVAVTGGDEEEFSGVDIDWPEISASGLRLYPVYVRELASNAECAEVAGSYLDRFLAGRVAGSIVARPNFALRLYDVVALDAGPPWGGGAITAGRVMGFSERFNSYTMRYEQELRLGDIPFQAMSQRARMGELG